MLVQCHIAFAVSFDQLQQNIEKLNKLKIQAREFGGNAVSEPSVIGWMPSAQIYFRDLDGHSLEFVAILPHPPKIGFVGSYSEWLNLSQHSQHTNKNRESGS